jgi:hypothetical protein
LANLDSQFVQTTNGRFAPNAAIPAGSIFDRIETCRPVGTMSDPGKIGSLRSSIEMTQLTRSGSRCPHLQGKTLMLGLDSTLTTSVTFAHCMEICLLEMMPL